jgi:hypothetical protein
MYSPLARPEGYALQPFRSMGVVPLDGCGGARAGAVRGGETVGPGGAIAKRKADPYGPRTQWYKVMNPDYSQKEGRAELFDRRRR